MADLPPWSKVNPSDLGFLGGAVGSEAGDEPLQESVAASQPADAEPDLFDELFGDDEAGIDSDSDTVAAPGVLESSANVSAEESAAAFSDAAVDVAVAGPEEPAKGADDLPGPTGPPLSPMPPIEQSVQTTALVEGDRERDDAESREHPVPSTSSDAGPVSDETAGGASVDEAGQGVPVVISPERAPEPAPQVPQPIEGDVVEEEKNLPVAQEQRGRGKKKSRVSASEPGEDPATNADAEMSDRLASARALRSEVGVFDEQQVALDAERDRFERRMSEQERLFEIADRILSFISQDAFLQPIVGRFELTRDHQLDAEQRARLVEAIKPRLLEARISLDNPQDSDTIFNLVYNEILGISVVGDLWRDDTVDEILIDAWNKITVERFGKLEETPYRFRSQEHANSVARQLSQMVSDRGVSRTNPLVTALLPRARVQFVWGTIAGSGLAISIRKFKELLGMESLIGYGSLNNEMLSFLADVVKARATILVSGGTGTGKTTFINALSEYIPDTERVVTIEDAFELTLSNRHIVSMQAKTKASADDTLEISQEDLMVASLRMRPDRIIVGEIREPAAAAVMLQAAVTGHDGTMTTIHASSATAALNSRMVSLLARSGAGFSDAVARAETGAALDIVVQITRRAGRRFVSEISQVDSRFIEDGVLVPHKIFIGELVMSSVDGEDVVETRFRRVGGIDPSTELGVKLIDAGIDPAKWEL